MVMVVRERFARSAGLPLRAGQQQLGRIHADGQSVLRRCVGGSILRWQRR
jgi:hypothetical protein